MKVCNFMLMKMKLTLVWRTKTKQWLCCTPPWHQLHWESAGVLHRITEIQTLGRVEVGHQSTQPQWNSSRNKAHGSCSVISRGTRKSFPFLNFGQKNFWGVTFHKVSLSLKCTLFLIDVWYMFAVITEDVVLFIYACAIQFDIMS